MKAYDTVVSALALMGFIILGWVIAFGTSEFHANPAQLQLFLQKQASAALQDAGHDWAVVEVNGQAARLYGTPTSAEAAAAAAEVVLTSSGSGGLIFGGITRVETAFDPVVESRLVSPFVFRAIKSGDGGVTFLGHVPTASLREDLLSRAASPTSKLTDRLDIGRGELPDDWGDTARTAIDQFPYIDTGELRFENTDVSLKGVALDDANRIRVVAEYANFQAPWVTEVRLRGRSHWQAEHVGDALRLTGQVEDDATLQALKQIAETHFNGAVVSEMSVAASDYDDWTDQVSAGLPHFAKFDSGEFAFDPKGVGFFVDGETSASTLQYMKEDMTSVESAFGLEIEAVPVAVFLEELEGVELGSNDLEICQGSFDLVMASNKVYFDIGNAVITRQSGSTLDKILAVAEMCASQLQIEVQGHTDSSGDTDANLVLSEARAKAVARYLQAAGFDDSRLIMKGYGSSEPAFDNTTDVGRAKNRRIEFSVQERSE